MPTLYLHIGMPKTGTSAIQYFCLDNREALDKQGFSFPILPPRVTRFKHHRNGHFLVEATQAEDGSFESPEAEQRWHRGMEFLEDRLRVHPNVILTDEDIWDSTAFECKGMWRNLKRESDAHGFRIRVIVYLRRQDQYLVSRWAQVIKTPRLEQATWTWERALEHATEWTVLDYHAHLEDLARVLGREALLVKVYDRTRFPEGDIVRDFLQLLGLTPDESFAAPKGDRNPSISGNMLEIKRIINTIPGFDQNQLWRAQQIALACSRQESEIYNTTPISETQREELLQRYAQSNRLLARDYFGSDAPSPFPPPEPLPPQWEQNNPQMAASVVRYFGTAMLQLQQDVADLRKGKADKSKLTKGWESLKRRLRRHIR